MRFKWKLEETFWNLEKTFSHPPTLFSLQEWGKGVSCNKNSLPTYFCYMIQRYMFHVQNNSTCYTINGTTILSGTTAGSQQQKGSCQIHPRTSLQKKTIRKPYKEIVEAAMSLSTPAKSADTVPEISTRIGVVLANGRPTSTYLAAMTCLTSSRY